MALPASTQIPINRRPVFLWQGLLIVLPVIVLALVGILSLRQDKRLVDAEARQRAQEIADDCLEKIFRTLHPGSDNDFAIDGESDSKRLKGSGSFLLDEHGELLQPKPFNPVPDPQPIDFSELSAAQSNLWHRAEDSEFRSQAPATAQRLFEQFVETNPPTNWLSRASYSLGVLRLQQQQTNAAVDALGRVLENSGHELSEAGIPLKHLALLRLLELAQRSAYAKAFMDLAGRDHTDVWMPIKPGTLSPVPGARSSTGYVLRVHNHLSPLSAVFNPSPITPRIVEESERLRPGSALPDWRSDQQGRAWYESTKEQWRRGTRGFLLRAGPATDRFVNAPITPTPWPRMVWLGESRNRLGVRFDLTNGTHLIASVSEQELQTSIEEGLRRLRSMPAYFGLEVFVAGRKQMNTDLQNSLQDRSRFPSNSHLLSTLDKKQQAQIILSELPRILEYRSIGKGSGQDWRPTDAPAPLIATSRKTENGADYLLANIFLVSPQMLYQRQSSRAIWLGLLIGASSLAATIGFISARRAFVRQHQLSEMKSNFVSSVSHELRAPIASVRLMAEGLERGNVREAPKQKEYFRFIVQECRRLSALIENVLDFSRIEQGRKQYDIEPTDVIALVRQTVTLMGPNAAERQIGLETQIDEAALANSRVEEADFSLGMEASARIQPMSTFKNEGSLKQPEIPAPLGISMDGRAIQQALVNLIDNALKHSPPNSTVTIGLDHVDERLWIWVEDHGEGIPPEEHERIFERFYRRGSELRRETQGIGIGLSIVKHIVEAHGGRMVVRSSPGQGSRFTIELPLTTKQQNG
jgi:signal transduction histidine kinase